jgi:hypothetical protein
MRGLRSTDRAARADVKPRQMGPREAAALLLVGMVGGCSCETPSEQAGSTVPNNCEYQAPLIEKVQTDILFVVDDSNSMSEEQEGVAQELPTFVTELQRGAGVGQELRVGLVNTSVYSSFKFGSNPQVVTAYPEGGWLRVFPAADGGTSDGARWLTDPDPEIVPRLASAIRALGISGSFQETPFEAARIALTQTGFWQLLPDGGSPNAGFLRTGARLLVVAVSDEDDCSEMDFRPAPQVFYNDVDGQDFCTNHEDLLTPVGDYVTSFQRLDDGRGKPREVLWGAIAPVSRSGKVAQGIQGSLSDGGPVTQNIDCPTSGGPGYRHRAMALAFDPSLTNLDSICAADYHQALLAIAQVAAVPQTLTLSDNVPDPRLLQLEITRADGTVQHCTLANGGISYLPPTGSEKAQVRFEQNCLRRASDTAVTVKLLCAG